MSDPRERCEDIADMIMDAVERYGNSELLRKNAVAEIEAFAKQEQIKGMEAACQIVVNEKMKHCSISNADSVCEDIGEKINAAIKKLKEGG